MRDSHTMDSHVIRCFVCIPANPRHNSYLFCLSQSNRQVQRGKLMTQVDYHTLPTSQKIMTAMQNHIKIHSVATASLGTYFIYKRDCTPSVV